MTNKNNEGKLSLEKDKEENNSGGDIFEDIFELILVIIGLGGSFLFYCLTNCSSTDYSRINPSAIEKPVLLDEAFIKNIKDECIINELKLQIDNMIKADKKDMNLTFDNYKVAKTNCHKDDEKNNLKIKKESNLENTKELLDKASKNIN